MPVHRIGIGLISGNYGNHWVLTTSFINAMSGCDWGNFLFRTYTANSIYPDVNRNNVGSAFLNDDWGDYLLMLDGDNGFELDAFWHFMEDMGEPGVHVVTGYYETKTEPYRATAGMRLATTAPGAWCFDRELFQTSERHLVNLTRDFGSTSGCVPTGCLMVKRKVLLDTPYPWFQTRWANGSFYTEDAVFSMRCEAAGYDLYLDTRIKSPHMSGGKCFPEEWRPHGITK